MVTLNYNWQLIVEESGSLNGNACNVRIYAKINSQSVANNSSSVSYQSRLYYGGSYFETWSGTAKTLTATGVQSQVLDGAGTYNGGETVLVTATGTVTHNNDGTKNVTASSVFKADPWGYNVEADGIASLPKINRVAITNSVTGSDIEQPFSVNYTKYVNNYQYKLRISIPKVIALETINYNTSGEQFTLSQETIENLYSRFTNTNTFNLGFAVETWNGNTKLSAGNEKIISCKITGNTPIFTNFDYNDINPITLALTGNSKYNINGYSTIRVSIDATNKAIAQKGATMVKYQFMIGSVTQEVAYSDDSTVYIDILNASIGEYKVYAIDSRNNSTLVTKLATQNINYEPLYLDRANSNVERDSGGIGENVTLNYQGTLWNGSFGQVNNAITIAKYEFKKVSDTTWITGTTNILPTISENNLSFSGLIRSNETGYIFPVQDSYNFRITLQDELSSTIIELTPLPSGIPNISLNKNGVGIMCDYDESLGGDLQVGGFPYKSFNPQDYVVAEYEVQDNNTDTVTFENLDIDKNKTYLFKIVGSCTVANDLHVRINDISSNYYQLGTYINGTSTSSSSELTRYNGYRPNVAQFYYGFNMKTNLTVMEGKISLYSNLSNNNYYPFMTWKVTSLWSGEQNQADSFGVLGTTVNSINKITFKTSNGKYRKGTKIQIVEENKFTIL